MKGVLPAGWDDEDLTDDDDYYVDSLVRTAKNLKITVVPDITTGAGLDGQNFDGELNEEVRVWFKQFKERYNRYKQTPTTKQQMKALLMRDPQPLILALKLFASCPGCTYLKNKSLALFILESVCELYNQYPGIASNCDHNTRMVAFNFIKTCGILRLYKAVIETYELHKITELLKPKLRELLTTGHFKDAAYWSTLLNVTHIFGLFDLVFPLILQDRISLAEEFLMNAKHQQLPTVQFLDSLLDKKKTVYEHCDEILTKYNYTDIKQNILLYRPMSKLVTRLSKKFNIDIKYTPKLRYSKSSSYLHYLYRKYQEGGMSFDSWRELARDEANKSKSLQLDLITKITQYDINEAMFWVQLYNVPIGDCPLPIQMKMQNLPMDTGDEKQNLIDDWEDYSALQENEKIEGASCLAVDKEEYLGLQLSLDCVILIDSKSKFLEMLKYLEQYVLIAFDSEWKPSVCNDNIVSILQLSTAEKVFLVDCLSAQLDDRLWKLLGSKIFNNLEILKVGFSLDQDIRMLHKTLPLQLNLQATSCYLDMRDLWHRLKHMPIIKFPYDQQTLGGESLSVLTELCLGKKLDKSNQFSNWANRPLRRDQLIYAALDAHCLILIYQVIAELLLRLNIDIDTMVEEITTSKSGYLFRIKSTAHSNEICKEQYRKNSNELDKVLDFKYLRNSNVKFICDSMLFGLTKELRKIGLDCYQIFSYSDLDKCIELAKREQRFVLTRNSRFLLFRRKVPENQCLQIPSDTTENQTIHLLQRLNIQIDEKDVHSRCVKCNCKDFLLATRSQIHTMRDGYMDNLKGINEPTKIKHEFLKRSWNLSYIDEQILSTKKTCRGKPIKVDEINQQLLKTKEFFYICNNCGVCLYDGAYLIHPKVASYLKPYACEDGNGGVCNGSHIFK
uniref:3'-5' exonuclease domain-containing protein n=1 Tax=Glossina morsitans morsitans TaxID=37546 RepID=A0A1B0G7H2_GLOMM